MSTIDLIQTLGIIISLIVTIVQMRLYIKGERVAIVTSISERNDALLNEIIVNINIIKSFDQPFEVNSKDNLFSDPRVPITYRIINFFDEMYYYYQQGFLAERTWSLYQLTMRRLLSSIFAKTFWEHVRNEYNKDFQGFVDQNMG